MTRPPLYGLDIVTDTVVPPAPPAPTTSPTLDPGTDRVVAVGVSLEGCERRFDGDEQDLLVRLDGFLGELPTGVLVSWHGGISDLPFLAARAGELGLPLGLRVRPDPRDGRSSRVSGADGGWCGAWHQHRHLDLARVYAAAPSWAWRVRRGGVPESLIPPSDELTGHDPRHDAHLARCLAERRWARARKLIDRMPPTPGAGPRVPGAPAASHTA